MRNVQEPEPRVTGAGEQLDLHSVFFTIQGEGPFSGKCAVFVRLAGCNLQCPGCDTEYTQGRQMLGVYDLVAEVDKRWRCNRETERLVVITGGEPLRQPIGLFVSLLLREGYTVQIETNGLLQPDPFLKRVKELQVGGERLHVVVSPKTNRIHAETAAMAGTFKYVIDANSLDPWDGLPQQALEHPSKRVARPPQGFEGEVIVTPYETGDAEKDKRNIYAASCSAMNFGYRMNFQIHKLIGVP